MVSIFDRASLHHTGPVDVFHFLSAEVAKKIGPGVIILDMLQLV